MKPMKKMTTAFLIMAAAAVSFATGAWAKEMTVQVNMTQLRATPAYYGAVVATVDYAARLQILETKGSWAKATDPKNNKTGWLHLSALTSKRLTPKAGAKSAPTSVSTGELSAAEKGFTEQIEKDYRQKNRTIDFTWVDRMEQININPQKSVAFLKDGQLIATEGGRP
ncbi:MAG: SH3 domain-containing protein [Deltaproteobacteria bacterium]|nr:SH3 domain-containing protein [Deltaproteobacteria bacterium]